MPRPPKLDRARERRILDEIVVDAYAPEGRAIGWYYYLEGKRAFPFKAKCVAEPSIRSRSGRSGISAFPFKAKCVAERPVSPLRKGEEVYVLTLAKDDCIAEILVLIRFAGRKLGIPLAQLEGLDSERYALGVGGGLALFDRGGQKVL